MGLVEGGFFGYNYRMPEMYSNFEDMKFGALCRFRSAIQDRVNGVKADELEVDFLERCDVVLVRTLSRFFATQDRLMRLQTDCSFLESLVSDFSYVEEDGVELDEVREELLFALEEMEDVESLWLAPVLFGANRLRDLYAHVERLSFESGEEEASGVEALRGDVLDWVAVSPLFWDEDLLRFRLVLQNAALRPLLYRLKELIWLHAEYASSLQERCLSDYPELVGKVRERLMREASVQARRMT